MESPKFSVFCDGGLCNRLNSLVVALIVARRLGVELSIYWPSNNWCEAEFTDVFDLHGFKSLHPLRVSTFDQRQVQLEHPRCCLIAHERQAFYPEVYENPNAYVSWNSLVEKVKKNLIHRDVVYFNSTIPFSTPNRIVARVVKSLPWNRNFSNNADEWMSRAGLKFQKYWSVHLRGTDYRHSSGYFKRWYQIASRLRGPLFLCSDDAKIKIEFLSRIPRTISREEDHLPEKYIEGQEWTTTIIDDQGRAFEFNVKRGVRAVGGAIVDLMILSRGKIVPTSRSTFLGFAMLMKWENLSMMNRMWVKAIQLRTLFKQVRRTIFLHS